MQEDISQCVICPLFHLRILSDSIVAEKILCAIFIICYKICFIGKKG